ncbi:MAG: thioredoxin family protein [Burkholderiales bacterium]|uniref:protein-disulfide reductase DsbD family protein n=1 Tax=Pandoraea sp. TaxID=1883445 RepID=UPI0012266E95|nr:cytochrome c biogenesis protein CcdA [Pandoraea sp.]MDE2289932.1 thioredoxin family protein [Burkholderiales bacterium]MDE2608603.1 thioredoxin family protein [Burkholderiales bacterium]TAL80514.1 MAG: thiol:disulfide interchange protein [Candidimonas sp.]TAM18957.1 MAG: thiol:disulfide interchange protein [Pandoraea sp.]
MFGLLFIQMSLAFGAGMLLNLTPCVLPAVPIKVRTILHETGDRPGARVVSAGLFTSGSVLFFAALGLATALLHLQWGVLFQSRLLLGLLSALLLALAVMNFRGRGFPMPTALAAMHSVRFLEPFLSGLIGALLSTPCTGPLLGGVLVFALTQPAPNIVAIFVSIGLGLASPYVVLILRPALLKKLPRAGAWSDVVRQSFGWALAAAAIFFVQSILPAAWRAPLWIALGAGLVAWVIAIFVRSRDRASRRAVAIIGLAAAALAYAGTQPGSSAQQDIAWQRLRAGDIAALPALGRPAIVEFTAQWCINCKILEHTVYRDREVVRTIRQHGVVPFQADLTRPDPALERLLASYGGAGLPFVAVLDRDGHEVRQFSGLFTSGSLVEAMKTLN